MRKENAVFFAAGLVFGVAIGYFVFQSVSPPAVGPPLPPTGMTASAGGEAAPARRVIDPRELAELEKRARENPNDISLRIQMGTLFLEAGRNEDALSVLGAARDKAPDDLHLRNHYALALENLERWDEALAEYEAMLAKSADYPEALLGAGRVKLYRKRDIRGGIELWERLLRVAPDSVAARSIKDELEALKSAHPGSPEPIGRGGSPEPVRDGGGAPSHAGKRAPRQEPVG